MRVYVLIVAMVLGLAGPVAATVAHVRGGPTPEERAYLLVATLLTSEQAVLRALKPVDRCTVKGHRQCLPAAASNLARVAAAQKPPVRKAVARQLKHSCSRRAGTRYIQALGLLERSARAMARARSDRELKSAVNVFARADSLETSSIKQAKRCWERLVK